MFPGLGLYPLRLIGCLFTLLGEVPGDRVSRGLWLDQVKRTKSLLKSGSRKPRLATPPHIVALIFRD